jgi:hypothetical protein
LIIHINLYIKTIVLSSMSKWYELICYELPHTSSYTHSGYVDRDGARKISIHYAQTLDLMTKCQSHNKVWQCKELASLPSYSSLNVGRQYLMDVKEEMMNKIKEGKSKMVELKDNTYEKILLDAIKLYDGLIAKVEKEESKVQMYNVTFNNDNNHYKHVSNVVVLANNCKAAITQAIKICESHGIYGNLHNMDATLLVL